MAMYIVVFWEMVVDMGGTSYEKRNSMILMEYELEKAAELDVESITLIN